MSIELTTVDLIKHFADRLESIDRSSLGAVHGKEPLFPMLVLFLGDEAIAGAESVARNLFQMWPQFCDELQFFGVRKGEEGSTLQFVRLASEAYEVLTDDEVSLIMDSLADVSNHFRNHEQQLLYYVLDTSSLETADELHAWMSTIPEVKSRLDVYDSDVLEMLYVLLDERNIRRVAAKRLRNALADYCEGGPRERYRIVLLSNRLSGGQLLPDWEACYRICSSLMALSNNDEGRVASALFARGVATVGYVRDEKPIGEMGQVVVEELVNYLAGDDETAYVLNLLSEDLSNRLGLSADGTLSILDEYVESVLVPRLPTPEVINLFPRWTGENYGDISRLTANELDDLTVGTWSAYLAKIVSEALEQARTDAHQRKRWADAYRNHLTTEFKVGELIYLSDHAEDVRALFKRVYEPSMDGDALAYAKRQLRVLLSSDDEVVNLFVDVVVDQARNARGFRSVWDELRKSTLALHAVHDQNLVNFYKAKVRSFFDRHGFELRKSFRDVASLDGLRAFLFDALDDIIESDSVFTSSYEDEQESRLSRDEHAQSAQSYIRKKLAGANVHTYLRVNFSLDNTILLSVLLKAGTNLSENLRDDLPKETYFYDTGFGNVVEVLNVYEVEPKNLLNDEGR